MNFNPFRPRILAEPSNNAGRAPAMPSGRRRSGVTIGSKHTGKTQGVTDVAAGTYWEALPLINGDALRWQRLLLAPLPEPRRPKDVKVRVDFVLDPTTGVMRADA